ncbi:MAG: DUF3124 domain-containing protein [Thermodesulfobacteriota bacterium]
MTKRIKSAALLAVLAGLAGLWLAGAAAAADPLHQSLGQTVYVPAYTQVYYTERGDAFPLAVTLLIHNTDAKSPITVASVKLHDTHGKLVKEYLDAPRTLAPFGALDLLAAKLGKAEGVGACFVVQWRAERPVAQPILECVMIGASGQQGISFRSQGRVIFERGN